MTATWKFDDAPNSASVTTQFVLDGAPILRVYHDYEGGWQFHGPPDQPSTVDCARLVLLENMISKDATLVELHDLPYGWCAYRPTVASPWIRQKNNPFPTFEEDGFYLEDAVWLSRYRDDVSPPSEEARDNILPGTYAKLLFRFAAENAERQPNDTERMWVLVQESMDDCYVGAVANDPVHSGVLACGDEVHFHPSHVMAVLDEGSA